MFIHYVPSANKIAKTEAKILAKYVFEHFSEDDRLLILTEMKQHLIDLVSHQIQEREFEIKQQTDEIELLIKTLDKLKSK